MGTISRMAPGRSIMSDGEVNAAVKTRYNVSQNGATTYLYYGRVFAKPSKHCSSDIVI